MNPFNYLFVADLGFFSTAYAIVNRFVDNETVRLLEISPCGHEGQILLSIQDKFVAEVLYREVQSLFAGSVLSSDLIEMSSSDLLKIYFHQNTPALATHALFLQGPYVSQALRFAFQNALTSVKVVEFKTLRTQPKSVQLVLTSDSMDDLIQIKNKAFAFSSELIENVRPALKDLFEVRQEK